MSELNTPNGNNVPENNGTPGSSGYQPPQQPPQQPPLPGQQPPAQPQPTQSMPQGYTQQIPQPPTQGYGVPPQNPYGYNQQPPYGQQPPYSQPYQPPQQPYQGYNPYGQQPPKKKVWPWVLVGCLLIGLLGLGGCVGCVAMTAYIADSNSSYDRSYDNYDYGYDYNYDFNDDFGSSQAYTFTYSEILSGNSSLESKIVDDTATNGVYRIGASDGLPAGRYFLEGDPALDGYYEVYTPSDSSSTASSDSFELAESITYIGNYYADFSAGDIVVFKPAAKQLMMPVDKASFTPESPYKSGLYLVGTDIPAGSYKVTLDETAAAGANNESAAYIMKDLEWDEDSILNEYYAIKGSNHTIEVKDGQWVEAYAVTLTPANAV
ncbi:MAG: hypothetical protein RR547_03790 [Raoultibacter sp.]